MQILKNLFKKNTVCRGIASISFLQDGIAVAISNYKDDKKLTLVYCAFVETQKTELQQKILTDLARQYKLSEYDCHLVLTTEHYRRFNIETPSVAENEIPEALRWTISDLIDFPADQAVIDFYQSPLGVRSNSSKMLDVIASPVEILTDQIQKLTAAALNLKVIDIQETVLRNLAVQTPENSQGIALLYLLEFSGTLLIQKQKTIYVSRKFEIGYNHLKLEEPNPDSTVINAHTNLALEIQRSLDYVESYFGISSISTLAVIPLAENTHILIDSLNKNLGISARMIDLSTLIDCDILVTGKTQSLCAAVIGATLRYEIEAA